MLYGRRKRLEELTRAEAQGQSFWTDELDEQARTKLFHIINLDRYKEYLYLARRITLKDLGERWLSGALVTSIYDERYEDIRRCFEQGDQDIVFSLLEAVISLPSRFDQDRLNISQYRKYDDLKEYCHKVIEEVGEVLREHRVNFDIIEGRFVPFQSRVMHENIVVPTLTLLGDRKDFANVEKAYLKALDELHSGSPDDAITDCSTALQEALTILGCKGNSLGPISNSAVDKGIINSYDKKLVKWVSADRSQMGDTHKVTSASTEDAWLAVHVVGAIILRITSGSLRSGNARR